MKRAILISLLLTAMTAVHAQQPAASSPAVPARPVPNANNGIMPAPGADQTPSPGTTAALTNQFDTNNFNPGTNSPDTNQFAATNPPPTMQPSNNFAGTNVESPGAAAALALTNRLATMSRAQAQSVIQVQVQLNVLQQIAVSIGTVQNVQQVVFQNPQTRQQLQEVSGQIVALSRGTARPSFDSVDRLSVDLLRACARARLAREHQLVLAIIINEACNSEKLTAAQFDESVNNGLIVLRTAGVAPAFCNSIGCDLHSIALEVQPNLGI